MRAACLLSAQVTLVALACRAAPDSGSPALDHEAQAAIGRAVARSIPLMQASMQTWIDEATCLSCHHQGLGTMAVSLAEERGFATDPSLRDAQVARIAEPRLDAYTWALQGETGINTTFGHGYLLLALAAAGHARDDSTDARAYEIAGNQSERGAWYSESHRPPLEDSLVTATAIATRALLAFGPDGRMDEVRSRVRRAREWLEARVPRSHEERVMRLLGLSWSAAATEAVAAAAADLAGRQNADGGWSQLPTLESDAYATGQALVALQQAGELGVDTDTYRRGVRFLLEAQLADGSWLVETRRRTPGLPYFETGFPHKLHQFISFAATAWATMALCLTRDPGPSPVFHGPRPPREANAGFAREAGMSPVHQAAAFGTPADLRGALAAEPRAADASGPGDLTPLMLAVHDARKARLLLEHGADREARSELGYTPLVLAGWYSGAADTLDELLERGAALEAASDNGSTALLRAARTGAPRKVTALLERGAELEHAMPDGSTALLCAEAGGDVELVRLLLDRGADLEATWDGGLTPLMLATLDGWTELVQLFIARGARLDARDPQGLTALAWAAKQDHGHAEIARLLLEAGADPALASDGGKSPLDWARQFGNRLVAELLESAPGSR